MVHSSDIEYMAWEGLVLVYVTMPTSCREDIMPTSCREDIMSTSCREDIANA